jgi:hypothetical protein
MIASNIKSIGKLARELWRIASKKSDAGCGEKAIHCPSGCTSSLLMVHFAETIAEIVYFHQKDTALSIPTSPSEYVSNSDNPESHNSQALRYYCDFEDSEVIRMERLLLKGYSHIVGEFVIDNNIPEDFLIFESTNNRESYEPIAYTVTSDGNRTHIHFMTAVPKFLDPLSIKIESKHHNLTQVFTVHMMRANLFDSLQRPRRVSRKPSLELMPIPITTFTSEYEDSCYFSSFDDGLSSSSDTGCTAYSFNSSTYMMPSL